MISFPFGLNYVQYINCKRKIKDYLLFRFLIKSEKFLFLNPLMMWCQCCRLGSKLQCPILKNVLFKLSEVIFFKFFNCKTICRRIFSKKKECLVLLFVYLLLFLPLLRSYSHSSWWFIPYPYVAGFVIHPVLSQPPLCCSFRGRINDMNWRSRIWERFIGRWGSSAGRGLSLRRWRLRRENVVAQQEVGCSWVTQQGDC